MKGMEKVHGCLLLLFLVSGVQASSLTDLYQETMASDPRLQRAESEAAIFQARESQSLGAMLPQVQVGAQGTRTLRDSIDTTGAPVEDYYYGEKYNLTLSQSLYNKPQWSSLRGARKDADRYSTQLEEIRSLVAVDVVDRYTKVLAAEDNYAFVIAERQAAEEQLKVLKARQQRQLAKITDVLAVEARANILLSKELDARNQVSLAREAMSELLGRAVDESLNRLRDRVVIGWRLGPLDNWIQRGLASNTALRASRLAVEAAMARVKEASGQRHPTLSLVLNAQKSDIGFENSQIPATEIYVAALNVSMPIYTGGQISAKVAEAQARLRVADYEHQQTERGLRKDIREAYLNTHSAMERIEATRKALISAEKSFDAQKKGLEFGTVTVVDVLDATETLFEARRDHRQAYYDSMVQGLTLEQVSGQFTSEKIAEINGWLQVSDSPSS